MIYSFELPASSLNLRKEEIYEAMGYGTHEPDESVKILTKELLAGIPEDVIVSRYLSTLAAEIQQDSISIQKMNFQTGKTIANLMKRAEQIAVFVATAGRGFERWSKSISHKDDWAALFITDSIGSCLVEKAGDYLETQLEQKIEKGLKHTNRFSPGYCGWNVTEQRKLFSLLPDNILGIQLSDSCMMSPIKSISGFIGIGKEVQTKRYGCQICELQTCFRKNKRKN